MDTQHLDTPTAFESPSLDVRCQLDEAHEQGFRRFCDERNLDNRRRASDAVKKLQDTLKGNDPPDYDDPYEAAAYLLDYHLSHCMMAYGAFGLLFEHFGVPDALYVCDVGAGTGAARVGLALALSERKESPAIHFDAFEPSTEMHAAGNFFWEALPPGVVVRAPHCDYHEDVPKRLPDIRYDALRVVTAFHLSLPYDNSNWGEVGEGAEHSIQSVLGLVSPNICVFTAHSRKADSLARAVGDSTRWDASLSGRRFGICDNRGAEVAPSRLHTKCKEEFGFRVTESRSRHRFKPPSPSVLLLQDKRPRRVGQADVAYVKTGQLLTKATGFMDAYDFTLNPYSGCSFGCTYCYAAFFSRDADKRDNWGYWVNVKANAIALLDKRRRPLDGKLIYMSSVTDPYQPIERQLGLTRRLLEIMAERHKPKLVVQTRSPLVERDCDLFRDIVDKGGRVQVNMTVTTDDEDIRRTFEPFCPANHRRLAAIRAVQAAGIDTCITMTPLLLVNDNDTFAADLIGTGVRRFIAQSFHFNRGKFVAQTRGQAFDLMAEKLGCKRDNFVGAYLKRYREFFKVLSNKLRDNNLPPLGEGKDGFAPPF